VRAADPFRYFLTLTSFQPLYGKLSDIFGRKPCLLFGYSIFGLGCLFCGFAKNLVELVGARAFAGECLTAKEYIKPMLIP
jgi:MFS family permease